MSLLLSFLLWGGARKDIEGSREIICLVSCELDRGPDHGRLAQVTLRAVHNVGRLCVKVLQGSN